MPGYEEDFREAARLEQEGDAAVASRQPASGFYRAAQNHLMPCGRIWPDRDEYDQHMEAFARLQEKLYQLDQPGEARAEDALADTGQAAREPESNPDDMWRELALQRRFEEAAGLLKPRASGLVGMGYYASRGYRVEDAADEAVRNEDPWGARISYEEALENYLLYSVFPARGDSEGVGYDLAERVVAKLEKLDE